MDRSRYSDRIQGARPRGRSASPGRGKIISRPVLGPTLPPIQRIPGTLSPGVKQPENEADRSLPTSDEIKNTWIYTSTPLYVFIGATLPLAVWRVTVVSWGCRVCVLSLPCETSRPVHTIRNLTRPSLVTVPSHCQTHTYIYVIFRISQVYEVTHDNFVHHHHFTDFTSRLFRPLVLLRSLSLCSWSFCTSSTTWTMRHTVA
jgi:hypothetical protein